MFPGHPEPCEQMWGGAQAASKLLTKLVWKSWAPAFSLQALRENRAFQQGGASAGDWDAACQGSEAAAVCRERSVPAFPLQTDWTGWNTLLPQHVNARVQRCCNGCNGGGFTYSVPSASSHLWDKVECPCQGMREWHNMSLLRTARSSQLHPGALDKASTQGIWNSWPGRFKGK